MDSKCRTLTILSIKTKCFVSFIPAASFCLPQDKKKKNDRSYKEALILDKFDKE